MNTRDKEWLVHQVRNLPHAARHRIRLSLTATTDAPTQSGERKSVVPNASAIAHAQRLSEEVYLKLATVSEFARQTGSSALFQECQSIQVCLFALEEFATGTPFMDALRHERVMKGMFRDDRKQHQCLAAPAAAAAASAEKTSETTAVDKVTAVVLSVHSRDVQSFGGPYWSEIPSFQLWLSCSMMVNKAELLHAMTEMYMAHFDNCGVHPAIKHAARAVLLASVQHYYDVLPTLRYAVVSWRNAAAAAESRQRGIVISRSVTRGVMAAGAFWDTVNRCCFVTGETSAVMVDAGVGPDFVECFVMPELTRVQIMTVKKGTRCMTITRAQVGIGDFASFSNRDDAASAVALAPEQLCIRSLKSKNIRLRKAALAFKTVVNLDKWVRSARDLHIDTDTNKRLYPL